MTCPLEETYRWFAKAVPNPSDINLRVQLGVHLEEVEEMLQELHTNDHTTMVMVETTRKNLRYLSNYLKTIPVSVTFPNCVATLDAICDQLVTATGFAYMLGMDPVGGLTEVNESNWSKFVDGEPKFDEHNKIQKGPDYRKPNLSSFV